MCELSKEELDGYFETKTYQAMSVVDYIKWKRSENSENDGKLITKNNQSDSR